MKKKEKETEKEKTKFLHSCAFRHFQAGPSCWACDREKKNEKRKEGEDIQGDQLHATGSSMPVVSLCIEEGGWPRIEIMGGTWVGNAHDVGAGGLCHCQDLEMVWPLWLLAKQEWGRVKTMFRCVLRGCANAQDWEKRKKKKKKKKRTEKGKKKTRTCWKPIHRLHGTGSSMPVVSLWVKGRRRLHANHRLCAEAVGGHAGDACDVYSSGCYQDLTMAPQLDLLARQGWGHARLVFGCVSRGCANTQDREKKKEKRTHQFEPPQKRGPLQALCVVCVCGFSAGM